MPATHPPASELAAFALGKLAPDDGAGVEAHLAVCEPCQDQTAAVPPDTLVEAVAAAYTLAVGRADGATPTFAAAATPSLGAATLGWAGGVPGSDDAGVPAALVGHPKYRVVRRLGEGGMGSVWLARHEVMHRDVAVKVIRPDLLSRPGAAGRFLREVRAAARLDHPNIVRAHDAEQVGDSCLLAMEYVAGDTLAELVKDGPLPVGEACRAVRAAARGLAHAHAAGLVHRDVKPHNLMRAADGTVKVLDFGLAGVGAGEVIAAGGDGLTGAGMVVGTPDYIAPEQVADPHAADARADIYGLGCTFYHLLAGRPAVPAGSIMEKLAAHESRTPDPIPGLAADLAAVLAKMLAKRPADRYQTADEVVAALDAVTDSWRAEGASPRRRWRSALAVATGLMFALAAVFAAVVYKVLRDNEEVVISTDDPDVEVVMLRKGELVRLRDPKSGQTWELNTLTKQLGLVDQPDGLTVTLPDREPFVLRRNGREVFRVTRLPRVVPMPAAVSVGETRRFEGHTAPVFCVAYSPDGRHVLSGAGGTIVDGKPEPGEPDSTLRLWDAATGKEVRRFVGHTNHLRSAAFSSDGTRLVSGGKDGTVRVWDVSTGKELVKCDGPGGYVHAVAFAPDGKSVLAGNFDGSVRLWDSRTGTEVRRFPGATGAVTTVAYAPGGRVLTGGQDGILRVWEAETGKVIRRFDAHGNWIMALACAPDGRRVLVAVAHEDGCWMYDLDTGSRTRCLRVGAPAWVTQINWTPDGRHALTCGHEGPVRLWDVSADRQVASFVGHTQYVWGVAVSPDGRHAVSGGGDGTVRLWRLPDPPTTTKPFAVVATNAQAERPFATLAEAVAAAGSGDTVEVRGNGPFVSAPITIQGKALTIRAGAGARPVVQLSPEGEKASAPLLKTDAALVLEGLDLQFIGAGNKFRPTWPLIHSTAPLSAANCRFLMACERQALCILADGCPAVELRNCEFLMLGFNFAMTWNCPPNGKLVVDNCVHLGRTLVNVDHRDNRPASVRLAHNTVVGFGEVAVVTLATWPVPTNRPLLGFEMTGNATETDQVVTCTHDPDHSLEQVRGLLPRFIRWQDRDNLYCARNAMLAHYHVRQPVTEYLVPGRTIADWEGFWKLEKTGSKAADALRFVGDKRAKDFRAKLADGSDPLTPADFRLAKGSPGQGAGKDGSDLGANLDLVGPGAAYERWKQTPAYREWQAQTSPPSPETGFVSLFNGKDLAGWKLVPGGKGRWAVEDGVLVGTGSHISLPHERGDFANFHLRAEVKVSAGGKASVSFRKTPDGAETAAHYRVEINAGANWPMWTGSLATVRGSHTNWVKMAPRDQTRADEWITLEVVAETGRITTRMNGATVAVFDDPFPVSRVGAVGLYLYPSPEPGGVLHVRKLEVRPLPAGPAAPAAKSDRELILGSWRGTAVVMNGQPVPAAALDLMQPTLTFTADKVTGKAAGAMPKEFMGFAVAQKIITPELAAIAEQGGEGVYHLDPTKSPKTIDIVTLGGARKTALGLYQLDGDTLKLCLSLDPAKVSERPKEFGSREGEGRVVVTLQRVPAAELPGSPNRTFALPKGPDPIPPPAPKP